MKRLTKRWGEQPYPNLAGKVVCEYKECDSATGCEDCIHGQLKDRLAAIEDILGDEYELDRLRELVEADREGRCVVLPTKTVFELVWCAGYGCNLACPVSVDGNGCCYFCDHGVVIVEEVPCRQEHLDRIGEDVFLTRAEAEAALKARERE